MEYGISGYQTDYRFMKKEVIQLAHETVPLTGTEQVDQIYLLGTKEDDNLIYCDIAVAVEYGATGEK